MDKLIIFFAIALVALLCVSVTLNFFAFVKIFCKKSKENDDENYRLNYGSIQIPDQSSNSNLYTIYPSNGRISQPINVNASLC